MLRDFFTEEKEETMSNKVSYIGEIMLTAEGKKHHDEVCEKFTKLFRVLNCHDEAFLLNGDGEYREAEVYDLFSLLTEKHYVKSGYVSFYSEENDHSWTIRYMPSAGKWKELEGHTDFEGEILINFEGEIISSDDEKKEDKTGTKTVSVTAYPYAVQNGEIDIPNNISSEKIQEYIRDHWNEIRFGDPELDYRGTDFEFDDDM